ncbi:hypothetical protein TrispH2_008910 [Trichoplax sp. H2]|nr:hypothetical protein TrispH2_008910 [Trichoplax sp. H2]|eukprot:RDD38706.1 hypothetical protein TrispH2_008910 [Trichoplax sp. H2]
MGSGLDELQSLRSELKLNAKDAAKQISLLNQIRLDVALNWKINFDRLTKPGVLSIVLGKLIPPRFNKQDDLRQMPRMSIKTNHSYVLAKRKNFDRAKNPHLLHAGSMFNLQRRARLAQLTTSRRRTK